MIMIGALLVLLPALAQTGQGIAEEAEGLVEQGKVAEARALLEEGVANSPEDAGLHAQLADLYFENYSPSDPNPGKKEILGHYQKAVELAPENEDYLTRMGWLYYWFGEWDRAETVCQKAIELNPQNLKAYRTLGLAYCAFRDENEKGEKVFLELVRRFPDQNEGYIRLGVLYSKLGKVEDSFRMMLKAISVDPDNLYGFSILLGFLRDTTLEEVKKDIARMGIEAKPDDELDMGEVRYKGDFYTYLGRFDEAEQLYRKALKKYPRPNFDREMVEFDLGMLEFSKKMRAKEQTQPPGPALAEAEFDEEESAWCRKEPELKKIWQAWKQTP